MKLLLSSKIEDLDVLHGMLDEQGIPNEVTNDSLPLPGAEFYPKLWVEESDFDRASVVLGEFRKTSTPATSTWTCPNCGEQIEEQFTSCWKCGTKRGEPTA